MEAGLSTNYPSDRPYILYMIFNHDFFYHTLHVYHFRKKKKPKYVTVGLNMFLHV